MSTLLAMHGGSSASRNTDNYNEWNSFGFGHHHITGSISVLKDCAEFVLDKVFPPTFRSRLVHYIPIDSSSHMGEQIIVWRYKGRHIRLAALHIGGSSRIVIYDRGSFICC